MLSLAVGASTQEVTSYPECSVRYFGDANDTIFGAATQYDSTVGLYRLTSEEGDDNTGSDNTIRAQQVQLSIVGLLLRALYDLDETIQVARSTGNCSFADVITLGILSRYENVTVATNMMDYSGSEVGVVEYIYTLPGNINLDIGVGVGVTSPVVTVITKFKSVTSTGWNITANWADATLLRFSAINIPVDDSETSDAPVSVPLHWDQLEAFKCTLSTFRRHASKLHGVGPSRKSCPLGASVLRCHPASLPQALHGGRDSGGSSRSVVISCWRKD